MTHIITPVLVNEEILLEGDRTVPLGSVNTSDELVLILPGCSDDDSFDGPLAPVLDCNMAVDVNAFCGWKVFEFKIMFSECCPINPVVLDEVVGLSDIFIGGCISDDAVSFNNKLLVSPIAADDDDGIGVDTGLELVLLLVPPPLVELLVADDNEFPEDDAADD